MPQDPSANDDEAKKQQAQPRHVSTKIISDDVFADVLELEKPRFVVDYEQYLQILWDANPELHELLRDGLELEEVRDKVYRHLDLCERAIFDVDNDFHILEKGTVRECIRVFRSIIGPINEHRTSVSALDCLWKLAQGQRDQLEHEVSVGFLMEFIHLFRGIAGNSNIYREHEGVRKGIPSFLKMEGREAAIKRTETLDEMAAVVGKFFKKYPSGLQDDVVGWRKENARRILHHFGASEPDWSDWEWQTKNVIKDPSILIDLIELTKEQQEAVQKAVTNRIPFGITPYYLSLMDRTLSIGFDHAIRAQVIPPPDYVNSMADHKSDRSMTFDFMGEHDTSPVDLVTRRYPGIAILKPYNTCSQICVYCQRNWEIDECLAPDALAPEEVIDQAVKWLGEHKGVGDVLITGGDPAVMPDAAIEQLLDTVSSLSHVYRIRLGTRTPVVLPQRWTEGLAELVGGYHVPGKREIAIVTHFVHSYEVTPEAMQAVQRIRRQGIGVYNQEVFTVENSRRFESARLRRVLRSIGVDPYYTFNMKGKEETRRYMVPIARILQERKEEARLLPGLDRTDEPVFNVPKLGKNHLRAWQDHRLVMVRPDGARVYEFHPWEKNITPVPPYNYIDVSIYDYLEELAARGENIRDYRTIWYYY
jgi:lysine 2,3-aminomutase